MAIYGPKAAASEEALKAELEWEQKTGSGVYGPLLNKDGQDVHVADDTPKEPTAKDGAPALEQTAIGSDYTLAELQAAIEGDPKLAKELILTELKRPQGARKGALRYFAGLDNLDEETAKLVNDALGVFDKPEE